MRDLKETTCNYVMLNFSTNTKKERKFLLDRQKTPQNKGGFVPQIPVCFHNLWNTWRLGRSCSFGCCLSVGEEFRCWSFWWELGMVSKQGSFGWTSPKGLQGNKFPVWGQEEPRVRMKLMQISRAREAFLAVLSWKLSITDVVWHGSEEIDPSPVSTHGNLSCQLLTVKLSRKRAIAAHSVGESIIFCPAHRFLGLVGKGKLLFVGKITFKACVFLSRWCQTLLLFACLSVSACACRAVSEKHMISFSSQ